ncbi:hypothetical protein THRCLA_06882 [Thraustotheca clavata]|uniref:Uncharacterized protein n=1 Tax=Thraustotheca clavata TaxID=74557 RepID=A0A1V9ZI87_9STRA|nr:hypothetical protein THRCLA_06882 [Thraustotheca clavata]
MSDIKWWHRLFRLFRREFIDKQDDDNMNGATTSIRKSLYKRWLQAKDEACLEQWIPFNTKVIDECILEEENSTESSEESIVSEVSTTSPKSNYLNAEPTYSYSYAFGASEFAKPLSITRVPVEIPSLYKRRHRFYVGGKNIPFTRHNHQHRIEKYQWEPMDSIYEGCLFLDFTLDPTMRGLVDYSHLIAPQRPMAQAFIRA